MSNLTFAQKRIFHESTEHLRRKQSNKKIENESIVAIIIENGCDQVK